MRPSDVVGYVFAPGQGEHAALVLVRLDFADGRTWWYGFPPRLLVQLEHELIEALAFARRLGDAPAPTALGRASPLAGGPIDGELRIVAYVSCLTAVDGNAVGVELVDRSGRVSIAHLPAQDVEAFVVRLRRTAAHDPA